MGGVFVWAGCLYGRGVCMGRLRKVQVADIRAMLDLPCYHQRLTFTQTQKGRHKASYVCVGDVPTCLGYLARMCASHTARYDWSKHYNPL